MFKNKLKVTGVALLMALSLTACGGGNVNTPNETAAPTVSVSVAPSASFAEPTEATLKPIAEPTVLPAPEKDVESDEMPAELRAKRQSVESIDLDYSFKNYSDGQIEKAFPSADFDTKAGAKYGLDFMQSLMNVKEFWMERPAGSDAEIIMSEEFTSKMDETLLNDMRKDIKKEGRFNYLPTAKVDGSIATYKGEKLVLAANPDNKFNTPAVGVSEIGDGNGLFVKGERTLNFLTTSKMKLEKKIEYTVIVAPRGDSWVVTGLYFDTIEDLKVVK